MKTLVWFREDLRLADNPALHYAAGKGEVVPIFIFPDGLGAASYWWLHHSLAALMSDLASQGSPMILRTGDPVDIIKRVCVDSGVDQVVWNRVYSPHGIDLGQKVKKNLADVAEVQSFNGQLLIEPTKILTKQETPYKVFTPFWRECVSRLDPPAVLNKPSLRGVEHGVESESLDDWGLLPSKPDWAGGLAERWQPGETGAQQRWTVFLDSHIDRYKEGRDFPATDNTSYLSPHLAFGEISPTQIWHDTQEAIANRDVDADNAKKFLSEIGWREFSRYLLVHFPKIVDEPFNERFADFPWDNDKQFLRAWQKGETGYPIVDAGMRELWHTGYMHNRVRMITASFLTKHGLTHWQHGMEWFWDTLVDADLANNTASWQWVAGSGADASPYFRIFNPILQGEKYDKEGEYIRRWVPELEDLPNKFINKPWEASAEILSQAGVTLGDDYPKPIVDHSCARQAALNAYAAIKQ